MRTPANAKDCLAVALRLLTRRDHSRLELINKLVYRGFAQAEITSAVEECLRLHYLDDARYASAYARQLQRKGYGCRRIQQMLTAKGLTCEVVAASLATYCSDDMQIQGCRQAMLKKLNSDQPVRNLAKTKARLYRFLFNRGFSPTIIRRVMDEALG